MKTGFKIDTEKCTECLRCVLGCSLEKTGVIQRSSSLVQIKKQWPETAEIQICRFDDCPGKPCIDVCPVEAIYIKDDIVLINSETCTGCGLCVEECPFNAIQQNSEGIAVKCDFCGGDPACVKECVTAALKKGGE